MGQPQSGSWAHAFRNPQGQIVFAENVDGSMDLAGPLRFGSTVDATSSYSGAPWAFSVGTAVFNGTLDNIFSWGYNIGPDEAPLVSGLPLMGYQTEVDYNDGSVHWMEHHFDYSFDGTTYYRPLVIGAKLSDATYQDFSLRIGSNSANAFVLVSGGTTTIPGTLLWKIQPNGLLQAAFTSGTTQSNIISAADAAGTDYIGNVGNQSAWFLSTGNGATFYYFYPTVGFFNNNKQNLGLSADPWGCLHLSAAAQTTAASQVCIGATTATTVGAAGGASSLPATPLGYLIINVGGTAAKIPYYNN